jgi:hypothetical protein
MKSARPLGYLFRWLLISLCLVATARAQEPHAPFMPQEGGGAAGDFMDFLQPEEPNAPGGMGQDLDPVRDVEAA